MTTQPKQHRRITGTEREILRKKLAARYTNGSSIRQLANLTDRSYGFIHQLLTEAGVTMRGRGGNTRTKVRKW